MGERAYMLNGAIAGTDPATIRMVADRLVATGRKHGLEGDDLRDWALTVARAIGLVPTPKAGPAPRTRLGTPLDPRPDVLPETLARRARRARAAARAEAEAQNPPSAATRGPVEPPDVPQVPVEGRPALEPPEAHTAARPAGPDITALAEALTDHADGYIALVDHQLWRIHTSHEPNWINVRRHDDTTLGRTYRLVLQEITE